MISYKSRYTILVSTLLALLLVWSGCGSTGSNEDPEDPNPPSTSFDSGEIEPDGTFSYTFETEGDVDYYCQNHAPDMVGQITVTSEAEAVDRDTVFMDGMQFNPANLSVAPNTEVVWINRASVNHTVTSGNPPGDGGGGGGDY